MIAFEGCESGANPFAEKYFRDCVYTYRDLVGFGLGLVSILVWLTAQLPQFISNIANQSAEALSIWFLVEWFAGDTLSLMGCIIQGQQLPTTTMLAAYFVLVDVLMLIQYIYYGALQARRARQRAKAARRRQHGPHTPHHHHRHHHHHHHSRHDSRDQSRDSSMRRANGAVIAVEASCPGPAVTAGTNDLEGSGIGVAPVIDASPSGAATATASVSSAGGVGTLGSTAAAGLHKGTAVLATAVSLICFSAAVFGNSHIHGPGAHGQGASLLLLGGASSSSMSGWGSSSTSARSLQQLTQLHILSEGEGGSRGGSSSSTPSNESLSCSYLNCDWALVAGTVMGYMSTCFYLASRVSQIKKNLQRRSTEGLSTYMFLLTMTANTCTGMSIALRLRDMEQFKEQLPWMCGTFGTIALDMVLFYQALTLGGGKRGGHAAGEQQQGAEHGSAGGASSSGELDGAVRDGAAKQQLMQHGGGRAAGAARTQQRAGPSRLGEVGRGGTLNGEEDLEAPLLGPRGQDNA